MDDFARVQRREIPPPRLVLAGVDNIEARHASGLISGSNFPIPKVRVPVSLLLVTRRFYRAENVGWEHWTKSELCCYRHE